MPTALTSNKSKERRKKKKKRNKINLFTCVISGRSSVTVTILLRKMVNTAEE